jgi:NTF2 fold immunity protein
MTPTHSPISPGSSRRNERAWLLSSMLCILAVSLATVNAPGLGVHEGAELQREARAVEAWARGIKGRGYAPPSGIIPNEDTALKIADAIAVAAYGESQISRQRPLKAVLTDGNAWLVWGTAPKNVLGGRRRRKTL